MSFQIAIDGPAGAGKGTVAAALAKELDLLYLDTGAMYRAVGLHALRTGVDTMDEAALSAMLTDFPLSVQADGMSGIRVFIGGEDVTPLIRTSEVSMAASNVSKWASVRKDMVRRQQEIAGDHNVVLEGRDIARDVLPNADLKIFLTATSEERARRRLLQLQRNGKSERYEEILAQIIARDYQDINREVSPLEPMKDSIIVDSTSLTEKQVIERILALVRKIQQAEKVHL